MIANGISANKYVNDKSNAVSDNSATNLSASANIELPVAKATGITSCDYITCKVCSTRFKPSHNNWKYQYYLNVWHLLIIVPVLHAQGNTHNFVLLV